MPTLTAHDGVSLHYEVHDYTDPWKDAPVLVLQHGNGRSGRFWFSLLPQLARHYRVVCPDLRGLGRSSSDFDLMKGINRENYVADLLTIIDGLGADTVHYAAESLGGIIGLIAAAKHPDRFRSLCVMSTPPFHLHQTKTDLSFGHASAAEALRHMGVEAWSRGVNSVNRFPPGTDPGLLEWYATEMGKNSVEVVIAMQQILGNSEVRDTRPFLPLIKAPVLALYPEAAASISAEMERTMLELVPDIKLIHIPAKGHMIWMLEPEACAGHMLQFFRQSDGFAPDSVLSPTGDSGRRNM